MSTEKEHLGDGYYVSIVSCDGCGTYLGVNYPSDLCTGCKESKAVEASEQRENDRFHAASKNNRRNPFED